MNTLAIDIGGTKFTLGLFQDEILSERSTCATDRSGGPAWMLSQIEKLAAPWLREQQIDRCGIGFGARSTSNASA